MDTTPFLSIRELVLLMDACKADYGNWGICVLGDQLWLGDDDDGEVLNVPLIDVIDCAAEHFPEHGQEEIFVAFGFGGDGTTIEWNLCVDVYQ